MPVPDPFLSPNSAARAGDDDRRRENESALARRLRRRFSGRPPASVDYARMGALRAANDPRWRALERRWEWTALRPAQVLILLPLVFVVALLGAWFGRLHLALAANSSEGVRSLLETFTWMLPLAAMSAFVMLLVLNSGLSAFVRGRLEGAMGRLSDELALAEGRPVGYYPRARPPAIPVDEAGEEEDGEGEEWKRMGDG